MSEENIVIGNKQVEINDGNESDNSESIYNVTNKSALVNWSPQHEKILVDWADKATCYKWLHEKTHREFARKNRWFTIPVIIMSTFTGTANFAQDRIPPDYLNLATMVIGTVNLVAGITTTIQQFLKISEMCESHRVSSISWGKFHRNIKIELAKSSMERTPVSQMIKSSKEEFDRLLETSQSIPNHIIKLFNDTFSGGSIKYDSVTGERLPLTQKQKVYEELTKPEICDSLESVRNIIYKYIPHHKKKEERVVSDSVMNNMLVRNEKKGRLESFINLFEKEKKRFPTTQEITDNIEDIISLDLIQAVLTDIECKYNDVNYNNNPIYTSSENTEV